MVQKSASRTRTGRPLAFDPDGALDAAMRQFWAHGFEATSLEDLERATGLSRSSLYNTFGSKRVLFERAVDRYMAVLDHQLLDPLETGDAGLADLETFVDRLGSQLDEASVVAGCLLTNSLAEFGGRDRGVVRQGHAYLDRARRAIGTALARASDRGEIDAAANAARTELILGLVLGVNIVARSGVGKTDLDALVAAVHAEIGTWRPNRPIRPSRSGRRADNR
jgi:TetR/AcrR family transcriptional regulator, transcriptional repressor for nem operon